LWRYYSTLWLKNCGARHPTYSWFPRSQNRDPGHPRIVVRGAKAKARTTAGPSTSQRKGALLRSGRQLFWGGAANVRAEARTWDGFVVSHPKRKDKDALRVGHPLFVLRMRPEKQMQRRLRLVVSPVSKTRRPGAPSDCGEGGKAKARTTAGPSTDHPSDEDLSPGTPMRSAKSALLRSSGRQGTGGGFAGSHPKRKDKDALRVGHPLFVLRMRPEKPRQRRLRLVVSQVSKTRRPGAPTDCGEGRKGPSTALHRR
jgi:hypothetical protein